MTPVAPRIVNSVSYLTRINDECDFSWQGQYSVMTPVASRNVNSVSRVKRIDHES